MPLLRPSPFKGSVAAPGGSDSGDKSTSNPIRNEVLKGSTEDVVHMIRRDKSDPFSKFQSFSESPAGSPRAGSANDPAANLRRRFSSPAAAGAIPLPKRMASKDHVVRQFGKLLSGDESTVESIRDGGLANLGAAVETASVFITQFIYVVGMFCLVCYAFIVRRMVLDPVSVHALLVAVPLRMTTWALHLQNTMD